MIQTWLTESFKKEIKNQQFIIQMIANENSVCE